MRKGKTEWENAGHGNLVFHGGAGGLFVDSQGNIYASGWNEQLQILRYGQSNWEYVKRYSNENGADMNISEDKDGNIWVIGGFKSPLSVIRRRKGQTDIVSETREKQLIDDAAEKQKKFKNV